MLSRWPITIAAALALGIPLQLLAASFNVKPGAWQMSMSTLLVGNPLPPEALASMPPEKRARVEEAMKARAGKPVTITQKTCVSKEDLDQDRIIQADRNDGQCTRKILSKSATSLVLEQTCPEPHASTTQMTIEAKSPEALSANIVRVRGDGKGKVTVDVKGFWLGPDCAGIKDDD